MSINYSTEAATLFYDLLHSGRANRSISRAMRCNFFEDWALEAWRILLHFHSSDWLAVWPLNKLLTKQLAFSSNPSLKAKAFIHPPKKNISCSHAIENRECLFKEESRSILEAFGWYRRDTQQRQASAAWWIDARGRKKFNQASICFRNLNLPFFSTSSRRQRVLTCKIP